MLYLDYRARYILEIGIWQFSLSALLSKEDLERYIKDGIKVENAKEKWSGTPANVSPLYPEMFGIEICGDRHEIAAIYQGTDLKYHILITQNGPKNVFEKYEEAKSYIEKALEIR